MIKLLDMPAEIRWVNDCTNRNYYQALWSTLVAIRPVNCLEIGTFQYYSANVFSHYFHEYEPDGKLITLDISTWNRSPNPPSRVFPLMIYPHRPDIDKFHGNIKLFHGNYKEVLKGKKDANIVNSIALNEQMTSLNIDMFDLSFVDGDHTEVSILADINMAKNFTKPLGWILIDDFTNAGHEVHSVISKLKCSNNFYQYEDWRQSPDMGLISNEKFSLEERLSICQ